MGDYVIPSWCFVGAKVACVDATQEATLTVGGIYTVARVGLAYSGLGPAICSVAEAPLQVGGKEYGYALWHFRPVVTRTQEQDAALFAPLLEVELTDALARANRAALREPVEGEAA